MGSCGTKVPKEHSYTNIKPNKANHRISEDTSEDNGRNSIDINKNSSTFNRQKHDRSINADNKSNTATTIKESATSNKPSPHSPIYQILQDVRHNDHNAILNDKSSSASDLFGVGANDIVHHKDIRDTHTDTSKAIIQATSPVMTDSSSEPSVRNTTEVTEVKDSDDVNGKFPSSNILSPSTHGSSSDLYDHQPQRNHYGQIHTIQPMAVMVQSSHGSSSDMYKSDPKLLTNDDIYTDIG